MPEPESKPAVRRAILLRRFARSVLLGAALIALSLAAGIAGYHYLEGLPWLDAFSNAAMILSGMGPLAQPQTPGGEDGEQPSEPEEKS